MVSLGRNVRAALLFALIVVGLFHIMLTGAFSDSMHHLHVAIKLLSSNVLTAQVTPIQEPIQ
jgi:hypothetical protein